MKIFRKNVFLTMLFVLILSQTQAQVNLTNGLVAYYKMEGDMTDASGNGYDGTFGSGTNAFLDKDRFQLNNTRLFSKGSDGSAEVPAYTSSNSALRTSNFTLTFWFRPRGGRYNSSDYALGTMVNASGRYQVVFTDNGLQFNTWDATNVQTTFTTSCLADGDYYMATLTYDGTTLSAYLNDVLIGQKSVSAPAIGSGAIEIGNPFEGNIDDIRIYNRAINANEVTALFKEIIYPEFSVDVQNGVGPLNVSFTSSITSDVSISSYYWSFGDGSTSSAANPTHQYDSTGVFHVYLKVTDANGRTRYIYKRSLISVSPAPVDLASQSIQSAEYFFDNDPGIGKGTAISITPGDTINPSETIDISALSDGFHQLMIRVVDNQGRWSEYFNHSFYIMGSQSGSSNKATMVKSAEYFFDSDPGIGKGTNLSFTRADTVDFAGSIDIAALDPGFHQLMVRVQDDKNKWSTFYNSTFYISKASSSGGNKATQVTGAEYYFDADPGIGAGTKIDFTAADSLSLNETIDISSLSTGFHQMFVRVKDDLGRWSPAFNRTFYIQSQTSGTTAAQTIIAAEYFIGTDPGIGQGTALTITSPADSISEQLTIAVSSLTEGQYTMSVRVRDDQGKWSIAQNRAFTISDGPISSGGSFTIDEDGSYTFTQDDFNYSSKGGTTFTKIRVDVLPVSGTLTLNGSGLSAAQEIVVADLSALVYQPNANYNGDDVFTFTVSDDTQYSIGSSEMNITINAVNDPPAFTVSGNITVDHDFTTTETVTVTPGAVPSDEQSQVVTFSLSPASVTFANVSIDAATGDVTITSVASEFGTQEFTIYADDGQSANNLDSATFTLTVVPANQPPQIADQSFSLDENSAVGTAVGTVTASDPESDAITFSIDSGNDSGTFSIDAGSGALTVADNTSLDYETNPIFTLTVGVTDGNSSANAVITINLNDVNEAPIVSDQTLSVQERKDNGTVVGSLTASDPEGQTLTWSISSVNTGDAFALSSAGELTVSNTDAIDYETSQQFLLVVAVSDGTNSSSANLTVDITDDGNQAPVITDQAFAIPENSLNGSDIGTVSASDPENDALTFTITAGNDLGAFALDASTGDLTVLDSTSLDFETNPTFMLTVEVYDGDLTASATVEVDLTDVVENTAPSIGDQLFTLDENSAAGTVVGTVVATDADGNSLTYSITAGNDLGGFAIGLTTGQLTVADESVMDFETNPIFNLTVSVTDGLASSSATITVSLNNLDENIVAGVAPKATFNLYPNPATHSFQLEGVENIESVKVLSVSGKKLLDFSPAASYDISSLTSGIYLIQVTTRDKEMISPLIKK